VFGPQPSPPADCTSDGTTVGTAAVSGNGTYNPSAAFTPPSTGTYWWYASYSGDTSDGASTSGCGAGMTATTVTNPADLALTNTGSPNPVTSGQNLTYTLTATNTGGQDATGVTVTAPLPASAVFGSMTASQDSCTRTVSGPDKNKGGTVTCTIGTLAGGATATVTITVTPTKPGTLATGTATVTASNVTSDGDDSATATVTVNGT
jgi:uncharacterized repeat protein (TIGR01451 family)